MTNHSSFLLEFDLEHAEWVVVAYYSQDANMIKVVESGQDPHIATGSLVSYLPEDIVALESSLVGLRTDESEIREIRRSTPDIARFLEEEDIFFPRSMSIRQAGKKDNHGLNYDEGPGTFALVNEIKGDEAKVLIGRYHRVYPGIRTNFHPRIRAQLREDRTLQNLFGDKRRFFDAWGDDLFKAGYAYIPQSTVVRVVNNALKACYEDKEPYMHPLELRAQVHDSMVCQYPLSRWEEAAIAVARVNKYMSPLLTCHGKEFTIRVTLKIGPVWDSTMQKVDMEGDGIAGRLEEAWERARRGSEAS